MDLTVSRPIKILALVGVLAAVGGYASMTLLTPSSSPSASAPVPSVAQLRAQRAAAAKAHAAPAKPAAAAHPAKRASHPKAPAAKPAAARPAAAKPTTAPAAPTVAAPAAQAPAAAADTSPLVAPDGLPMPLAIMLRTHRIVVVSIFDPQAQTDAISYAEARAGAAAAGVGFLGVSVLDGPVSGPLTAILPGGGLLPDPGVLIFRAPDKLIVRIDGFADKDSVAQAAVSALTADPIAPPATAPAVTTTTPDTFPATTTTG